MERTRDCLFLTRRVRFARAFASNRLIAAIPHSGMRAGGRPGRDSHSGGGREEGEKRKEERNATHSSSVTALRLPPPPPRLTPFESDACQWNYATVNLSLSLSFFLSVARGAFLPPRGRWSTSDKINGGRPPVRARDPRVDSRNLSWPSYIYYRRTRADNRLELLVAAKMDPSARFLIILADGTASARRRRRDIDVPSNSPNPPLSPLHHRADWSRSKIPRRFVPPRARRESSRLLAKIRGLRSRRNEETRADDNVNAERRDERGDEGRKRGSKGRTINARRTGSRGRLERRTARFINQVRRG